MAFMRRKDQDKANEKDEKVPLHEKLEVNHLLQIKQVFFEDECKRMNKISFQELLKEVANITYEEDEFEILYMRINSKRDGFVSWDEFISHLILEFQEKEVSLEFQSLDDPIPKVPVMYRSNHRHPVNRITFCPTLKLNRTYTYSDGTYITCSKDGIINYWSLDWQCLRTVQSTCPELKVQPTWILDMVCMPDVNVICTSGTERDLRFYDTSAQKFELRVMITSFSHAIVCMHYVFSQNINEKSKLIFGTMGGSVRILMFSSIIRGPFKSTPGVPLTHFRYEMLTKGLYGGFQLIEFRNTHTDWVRQVSYYSNLNCIVSCSSCPRISLMMRDITECRVVYVFRMGKGAWCFALADGVHMVATGGSDCLVRVWNPFVPHKPSAVFSGHHAGIVGLVLQDAGKTLFSLSKDKCIKVWDVKNQVCLQTYFGIPPELGEHTDFTIFYNPDNRQLYIGGVMIAGLHLCPQQSGEHTDGTTHSLGVTVVLYNPLFKIVLTCGLDSLIIVWDPWTGRRMMVVKKAHTRLLHGELIPVEITAGCFDPGMQRLITGAGDGTLKMWNFNTGTCLRNMRIEPDCEVTSVIWIKGRILATGWNRHVTEFADSGESVGPGGAFSKPWDTRHTEDVLCATSRVPQAVATSTYNGELILWKMETGQPYKKYNVINPTERIKIQYKLDKKEKLVRTSRDSLTQPQSRRKTLTHRTESVAQRRMTRVHSATTPTLKARRVSVIQVPDTCVEIRGLAVHCMIFLDTRPMLPDIGTLLVAVENGTVQVWSHHPSSGFIESFSVIHKAGDYVISMATDAANEYLFTGTTLGYIKIWLMKNYTLTEDVPISMIKYRLLFPFLWRDRIVGRAKRTNRGQLKPVLLSSYKGHRLPVSGLTFIDSARILISSSADCSARLWTLGGKYLGTLGSFKPWIPIKIDEEPPKERNHVIPPDLRRVISSTTFKVLVGGIYKRPLTKKQAAKLAEKEFRQISTLTNIYGKRLEEPYLGHHYQLPERTTGRYEYALETSFAYIPVYQHLIMPRSLEVPRPSTPTNIAELRTSKEVKGKSK